MYCSVPVNTITWEEPIISSAFNTMFVKFCAIQDLQDHFLFTTSAEDFTSPSNPDKLLKITKEKGIQDIMANTTGTPSPTRPPLSASTEKIYQNSEKITIALHIRICKQPEIAAEMDKYIQGQIDNGNYVEIHYQEEERKSHHLHLWPTTS